MFPQPIRVVTVAGVLLLCGSLQGQDQGAPGDLPRPPQRKQQAPPPEPVLLDEIVARVNDQIITRRDLDHELYVIQSEVRRRIQDREQAMRFWQTQRRTVLRELIDTRLLLQKAEELGVAPNVDDYVSGQLEEMRKESGIPSLEAMDQAMRRQGMSLAQMREKLRQRAIQERLLGVMVYSRVTLLTPEIQEYYDQNREQYTEPEEVELAEILFLTEGKEKEQVRSKAQGVLDGLKAGGSFEELAKEHSEGPTANRGGSIGAFKRGSMQSVQETAVSKLEEGGHSGLIEADYGFQILRLLKRKPARQLDLETVRSHIEQQLFTKKAAPQLKKYVEGLREESFIYVDPSYQKDFDVEELGLTTIEF
ncbi:MAG: peptidylprolyl isomerase [Candidatus Aminicenantes bacterium]|nr:peptidylprolyl isomerase [Candidatus Aminicenantes bacterium]